MSDKFQALAFWHTEHSLLTIEDLACSAGLHPRLVETLVTCGLIEPAPDAGARLLFPPSARERLRRIIRLRRDLGVNLAGAAVILHMRERIEALQMDVRRLSVLLEQHEPGG